MAARKRIATVVVAGIEPPSDPRRRGSLLAADPSFVEFPRNVHAFDDPTRERSNGEVYGTAARGTNALSPNRVAWGDFGHPIPSGGAYQEPNDDEKEKG